MKSETRTTLSERDALVLLSSGSFRFVPLTNETGREAFVDASEDALIAFDEKSGTTFLIETEDGKTILSVFFGDGYYFETFTLSNDSGTVRGVTPPAPAARVEKPAEIRASYEPRTRMAFEIEEENPAPPAFRSLPEKPITGEISIADLTPAETALRAAENDEPEPGLGEDDEENEDARRAFGAFEKYGEKLSAALSDEPEPGDEEERLSAFSAFELLISGDTSSVTVSEDEKTGAVYVRDGLDEEDGQFFSFAELSPNFEDGEETTFELFSRLSSGSFKFGSVIGTEFETFEPSDAFAKIASVSGFTYVYYRSEKGTATEDVTKPGNVILDVLDQRGTRERSRRFVFAEERTEEEDASLAASIYSTSSEAIEADLKRIAEEDARKEEERLEDAENAREDARAALAPSPGSTLSALSIDALSLLATKTFRPLSETERIGFAGASPAALIYIEPDTNDEGEETDEGNLWIFDPGAEGGARLERFGVESEGGDGEDFFIIESVYSSRESGYDGKYSPTYEKN